MPRCWSRSIMVRMIRAYQERTGFMVGYKPAGGISAAKDVLNYQFLMKEELGREWLEPDLFPHRRLQPAGRYRAPARASRDRPLFGL